MEESVGRIGFIAHFLSTQSRGPLPHREAGSHPGRQSCLREILRSKGKPVHRLVGRCEPAETTLLMTTHSRSRLPARIRDPLSPPAAQWLHPPGDRYSNEW